MKFWNAAILATGVTASAVIDPPLVPADNKVNLFADNAHHGDYHKGNYPEGKFHDYHHKDVVAEANYHGGEEYHKGNYPEGKFHDYHHKDVVAEGKDHDVHHGDYHKGDYPEGNYHGDDYQHHNPETAAAVAALKADEGKKYHDVHHGDYHKGVYPEGNYHGDDYKHRNPETAAAVAAVEAAEAAEAVEADEVPPPVHRIPTSLESAVLARRILALTRFGTVSTVFQQEAIADKVPSVHSWENRPLGLAGIPVGLPEYLANCEEDAGNAGNPTLLAIRIATTFKNARAGSNVSLSLQWEPPFPPAARLSVLESVQKVIGWASGSADDKADASAFPPSVAALPRFSLIGYLEPITGQDAPDSAVASCFVRAHPDAKYWLPGSRVHQSEWQRLVVTQVYWIGGFGDRAYIGWIPAEEWHNVTRADWEKVKLPGEVKGFRTAPGYEL